MARKRISNSSKQLELGAKVECTALYIRVSTEKQANEGYGLEAQRAELDAYCFAQGWTVCEGHVYVDAGVSGKSTDRPAFQAMLQAAQDGKVQRIVATKLDRIARNLKDLLNTVDELKSYGCALVIKKEQFDTSTPQGLFVLQMLGAVSELERSMIGERVQSGRVAKANEGGYNGSACPLGYEYVNGAFKVNPNEAYWVREVFTRFLAGDSLNAISRAMNDAGATTKKGGAWYAVTVDYILRNGAYAALSQWNGVEAHEGVYPAIVSVEQYEAAQQRLAGLRRGKPAKQS